MKKLLLFAAAAASLVASAQTFTQATKVATEVNAIFGANNQCIGMDGNFYMQNGVDSRIDVYGAVNGALANTQIASTGGTPITVDDAGNLILSGQTFPNVFAGGENENDYLLVIPADGGDAVQVEIPEFLKGRVDLFGKALGDVMSEDGGHLFLTTNAAGANDIYDVVIVEGELDARHSQVLTTDITVSPTTVTTVSGYVNAAGETHILYYTRNAAAIDFLLEDGELTGRTLNLPNKGSSCGAWPFTMGGKDYIAYPTKLNATTNYLDGFAIAEIDAEGQGTIVAETEETIKTPTARQIHNLNVQVDGNQATIYQYVPANYFATYTFGAEAEEAHKIYIDKASEGNFWAWDQTGEEWNDYFAPWPGKAISELPTEVVNGTEYYVFEFTGEKSFGMLFNEGDGSTKTSDIVPEWGKVYKYNGGTEYEVDGMPVEPEPFEITALYVTGSFNEWTTKTPVEMELSEGIYTAEVDLEDGAKFKLIAPDGDGWKWFGGVDENTLGYFEITPEMCDGSVGIDLVDGSDFYVAEGGHYTISADVEAMKMYIVKAEEERAFYVSGNFNGWSTDPQVATELVKNEDGVYEATLDLQENDEFKIITPAEDGWIWLGGLDENKVGYFLLSDDVFSYDLELVDGSNFRVAYNGNYTLMLKEVVDEPAPMRRAAALGKYALVVVANEITAVEDINAANVAAVKYVNMAGQVSAAPFAGVNLKVVTMTDGTKKVVKVVK